MTGTPTADLSKLRINRDDPPPAVKRALGRVLWIVAGAVLIIAVFVIIGRRGAAVPVQVVTVSSTTGGAGAANGGGGGGGSVAVVANGYVVAEGKRLGVPTPFNEAIVREVTRHGVGTLQPDPKNLEPLAALLPR